VNPPVTEILPKAGRDLTTSIDIDIQRAAEDAIGDSIGAAVAIDVRTGEVLALVSKPDYDLNQFPRNPAAVADVQQRNAWTDLAVAGRYAPGSTFKVLVSIAGLLSGRLSPTDMSVDCEHFVRIGNRRFGCDNGKEAHGRLNLQQAIADSCDIYFYEHGIQIGPQTIVREARRMHLEGRTGIELPLESRGLLPDIPKLKAEHNWYDADTAEISIGQGAIAETPLHMACFAASVARGETWTQPTLLHDPNRPTQHHESIGLTPEQRQIIVHGMEDALVYGTAKSYHSPALAAYQVPGLTIAGKTGTATLPDRTDAAWFICFAPAEDPQIAVAVVIKGQTAGEEFQGGLFAMPVAARILQTYFKTQGSPAGVQIADSPAAGSASPAP
jgi:penicillin-binding protein 2